MRRSTASTTFRSRCCRRTGAGKHPAVRSGVAGALGIAYAAHAGSLLIQPRVDASYQDATFFDATNTREIAQLDDVTTVNALVKFGSDGGGPWKSSLGVNNATDELYPVAGNSSLTTGSGYAEIAYARPRGGSPISSMSSNHDGSRPRHGPPGASNVNVTVALCLLCAVLEGFDIQAMGVAAPRLVPEFGLSPGQMGWVFSISNIGLVIGAAFGGWLADRVGRKPVFIAAVATFGVFTLGVALAGNFTMLFVLRFLAGLGFGGAMPNMMAMATELSAPGKRAQTAAIMFCGMPIGGGFSAVLTQVLPPDMDWRALFVVGGVLADAARACAVVVHGGDVASGEHKVTKRHSTWHILFGEGRARSRRCCCGGRSCRRC